MRVLPPCAVAHLAHRIESAYRRHQPELGPEPTLSGLWSSAAVLLMGLHHKDPGLPLDPELFVAAQGRAHEPGDLWETLASTEAGRRYSRCIRLLIRQLRREIETEIRCAQRRVQRGLPLEVVLDANVRDLSPLGCYVIALRTGRTDLASRFRNTARAQHQNCPLYRQAVAKLIASDDYPVPDSAPGALLKISKTQTWRECSVN